MRATVLLENSTPSDRFCAAHGLSLFLETDGHKILFDMGPNDSFIANAKALGIDVTEADVAFLSHGHFDHGGGLPAFLALLDRAELSTPVYLHEGAFCSHQAKTPAGLKDIGIDPAMHNNAHLRFVEGYQSIDDQLSVFTSVEPKRLAPQSNRVLLEETPDGYEPDPFTHELSLLVRENDGVTLVTGCSHNGIVNIVEAAEELIGGPLKCVIAGFHLMNPSSGEVEDPEVTEAVARFLADRPTRYYTFHCTGHSAYSLLRDELGERVDYLPTGSTVVV